MSEVEARLHEQGLTLPEAPEPVAAYIPAKRGDGLVHVSGQIPLQSGELAYNGKVGGERTLEEGYEAARICTLNALAVVKAEVGSLDAVEIVQVRGYVNATADFEHQPEVVNGASELLGEVFGERGTHARAAVGVASLPRNAPVEIEMTVRIMS